LLIPLFAFAEKIRNLSPGGPTENELQGFLLQSFLLKNDRKISMYYAPFDWINTAARVVIVGITPGKDSMLKAFDAAATVLA
jgi:hypothetical protein